MIEDVLFKPQVDLEGFKVVSEFDIDSFGCEKLETTVGQIAILLYSQEQYNEKFLLKIRNCVINLKKDHVLKKWLEEISQAKKVSKQDASTIELLDQVLNSPFNLITDLTVKKDVISLISEIPQYTIIERLVRSYLYLMIGNITQSDKIIKSIISEAPRDFFKFKNEKNSIFHTQGALYIERIFEKLRKHPADRLTFGLFIEYLKSFSNSPSLLKIIESNEVDGIKNRILLKYTEQIAPDFLSYLKLKNERQDNVQTLIKKKKINFDFLAYWLVPFSDIDLPSNLEYVQDLKKISHADILWFNVLISDEKVADFYIKNSGGGLEKNRTELRSQLNNESDFMLILFRLIQLGDIDKTIIDAILKFKKSE